MSELKILRGEISNIVKPYLYIPMLREDDEEFKNSRALEVADKIIDLILKNRPKK